MLIVAPIEPIGLPNVSETVNFSSQIKLAYRFLSGWDKLIRIERKN